MPDRTCQTCLHGNELLMAARTPPVKEWRCFRVRSFRSGAVEHHLNVGRSCAAETDQLDEPQRGFGQKCGPDRVHWEAVK